MCAIFGIYSEFISKKELQSKLINSLRMLKHRGPDSSSHIINNAFASGVNRLAIGQLNMVSNQSKMIDMLLVLMEKFSIIKNNKKFFQTLN